MATTQQPKPRFSVIVPVYNVARWLPACVKSVVEQTGPADWECILVDDGSTDAGGKMCDVFAQTCPGVIAVHQTNQGLAAARNTGLDYARGDWVLFLDSDDLWPEDMLLKLRLQLAAHPGYNWYICRYLEMESETGRLFPPTELKFTPGPFESDDYAARVQHLYDGAHWSVWKYCLRRDFMQRHEIRFWPSVTWAEDYPFDLQLLRVCYRFCFLDMVMTLYREGRPGSLLNNSNLPAHFTGILAAQRCFAYEFTRPGCTPEEKAEIQARLGDVFWPQARTAAVRDKALRRACAPLVAQCRPLYSKGSQCRGRKDWVLYRLLLTLFGARFGLWAASLLHRPKPPRQDSDTD